MDATLKTLLWSVPTAVAVALVGTLLGCAYFRWFRDSTFVKVERVTVTGLTSGDAGRIRASLEATARGMTTLHVDREQLEKAVGPFSVVGSLEVAADFPHAMRIHVVQQRPVAVLGAGEKRVPVAADGSVLSRLPVAGPLPRIRLDGPLPATRLSPGAVMPALQIAAALPVALRPRVKEIVRAAGKGLVVPLEDGPRLIFGTAARARAKWAAAVRVLGDPDAAGADYIDVRIPERPAAGGLESAAADADADQTADGTQPQGTAAQPQTGQPTNSAAQP
jgi:cell division protein FtsQ